MDTTTRHYSTDPKAKEAFDRNIKLRPDVAVKAAIGLGFSVVESDVPTPHLDQLRLTLDRVDAGRYSLGHAAELTVERLALAAVRGQGHAAEAAKPSDPTTEALARLRAAGQDTKANVDALRERFVLDRVAQLEAEHEATLRVQWKAKAEAEADAKFGAVPVRAEPRAVLPAPPPAPAPAAPPAPAPRRTRKVA